MVYAFTIIVELFDANVISNTFRQPNVTNNIVRKCVLKSTVNEQCRQLEQSFFVKCESIGSGLIPRFFYLIPWIYLLLLC